MSKNWEMIITDLDGTLLNNNREVSLPDMKSLFWLGENNITRVIATGRSFNSTTKVLKDNFPIDYLIFSYYFLQIYLNFLVIKEVTNSRGIEF